MADISGRGHMQTVLLYKAPECGLQDLKEALISRLLPILNIRHSNIMIMGDFNLDIQNENARLLLDPEVHILEPYTKEQFAYDLCQI
jgi:hypothetical protein